jgi:16S rRNA (uracil1498-N3)-methyltransferase
VLAAEHLAAGRPGDRLVLDGEEGRHAATVRRVLPGERVDLVDGHGTLARCVTVAVRRGELVLEVRARVEEPEPAPRLVVVQALAKGERGELAVALLTEVGADVVIPWAAERCVVQWRAERGARGVERWRRSAREAGKQARRARFPDVAEPVGTDAVAQLLCTASLPVVLHEEAELSLAGVPVPDSGDVVLVVGPEGGLTPAELAVLAPPERPARRLGPTVLRTSTAGAVAAAVLLAGSRRWVT